MSNTKIDGNNETLLIREQIKVTAVPFILVPSNPTNGIFRLK